MNRPLRICFLVLALILTLFGWSSSRAGVCLVWTLLCIEELVSLQIRERKKPVPNYRQYKLLLFAGIAVFLILTAIFLFST